MHEIVVFKLNEAVTWQSPEDRKNWASQYRRLVRIYGAGPFQVVAITRHVNLPHRQELVLMTSEGKIMESAKGTPDLFCGTWLKKAEGIKNLSTKEQPFPNGCAIVWRPDCPPGFPHDYGEGPFEAHEVTWRPPIPPERGIGSTIVIGGDVGTWQVTVWSRGKPLQAIGRAPGAGLVLNASFFVRY